MKRTALLSSIAAAALSALAVPAAAQEAGDIQVKLLATGVLPDGKIKDVDIDLIGLPAGTDARADDNYVPTIAVEYFVTPNVSIETICCVTQHDVSGAGALSGATLVSNARIIPATVTAKYHFGAPGGIRPYVGAGPTYFLFFDDKVGATARTLGAESVQIDDTFGFALQAGVDVPLNAGFSLTVDAKRYFLRPDAHFYTATGVEALSTHHRLDPWVVSAGVAFRF